MAEIGDIEEPSRPPGRGRGLALLGWLLLLAVVAGGSYLLWRVWEPEGAALAELELLLEAEQAQRLEEERRARAERARLADDLAAQVQVLANTRRALAEISETRQAAPSEHVAAAPSPGRWQLGEAEYLLRLANHRLRLERDAPGAADLLAAADEILATLDAPAFHDVRALLAEETASLRAFRGADVPGLFLRIEAAKGLIDALPLRLPEYAAAPSDDAAASETQDGESSMLEALLARTDGLVRFRRHELAARRPLLAPDEAEYLEQHLRLALDRAQLALLRGDQAIFAASLSAAVDALDAFVDPSREAAAALRTELDEVRRVDLARPAPDISGSLAKLRELRRAGGAAPDAAGENG